MIIYLHGFDATSPGNHEKILQLQFIDPDVRFVTYSTLHPRHDMSHILKEVKRELDNCDDPNPIMVGVGLGGYWCERVAFLSGIRSVILNPNLHPELNMEGKIDRPEEYSNIATKCVTEFRAKNKGKSLCILSVNDQTQDNKALAEELEPYYTVVWDEQQEHKFKNIASHLPLMKEFKQQIQ
ncbi:alpha/beta hydrolase YcfP [Neiella marina]|uniref:Alpha/beta hydrolase YcfP n=1 Tax=Neiella holothuriorum TaxID=2870530 RepID=A0ABS7EJU1_9GAMM|nr:alpha/beta hydrolase YcfP [Neiella holothuriorum]MBW8192601.1 alpha/beta hydrolase YcfP [Neiella holothuriorum]